MKFLTTTRFVIRFLLVCSGFYVILRINPAIYEYSTNIHRIGRQETRNTSWHEGIPKHVPTRPLEEPTAENPRLIIIVAYMHTGSSYIGSLFQQHPGTFYEYEPIRGLRKQSRENGTAVYLNGTTRKLSGHFVDAKLAAQYVNDMLRCNHGQLDLITLIKYYFNINNQQMRDSRSFLLCQGRPQWYDNPDISTARRQQRMAAMFYTPTSKKKVRDCLPQLTNKCMNAKIRVSKFIRIGLDTAELLLREFPQLKVIHLFRDPRSMLDSQMRKHEEGTDRLPGFKLESIRMCERMRKDIAMRKQLDQDFPGAVMGIRYEDFTKAPIDATKAMFDFTGLSLNKTLIRFIQNTSVKTTKNSTVREAVWRSHMDQIHLDVVNKHCSDILDELGYIKYKEIDDIRNRSSSTIKDTPYTVYVPK